MPIGYQYEYDQAVALAASNNARAQLERQTLGYEGALAAHTARLELARAGFAAREATVMPAGYLAERAQAIARAPWGPAVNALLTFDEYNLLASNTEYRALKRGLSHQFATLTPAAAAAQLRTAMTAPGAPSVRFFIITRST